MVRRGGRFGVYLAAARHLRRYGDQYDAVVDFQNGIPFFAPLVLPGKAVVCVVHHVHRAQFDMYFRWPFNLVAGSSRPGSAERVYRGRLMVVGSLAVHARGDAAHAGPSAVSGVHRA